ncbi:MAG: BREX-1 system phosphatase PglZ type A [Patescibacteria group bacterium]|nr:BREX-1 system phosphatase PglZ type A [Patescibacteria group bacterium]
MNINKIKQSLQKKFAQPKKDGAERHIVFWYDEEQAFADAIDQLDLKGIKIHIVNKNYFKTKLILENKDQENDYLIYIPERRPPNHENWLLDIYLYSQEFSADKASLILQELGIDDIRLKDTIKKHQKFFNSGQRLAACKEIIPKNPDPREFKLAMLAAITSQKTIIFEDILRTILVEGVKKNSIYKKLKKYRLDQDFWELVRQNYGYYEKNPSLKKLRDNLLVTHFLVSAPQFTISDDLRQFALSQKNNAYIFVDHWKNNKNDSQYFEKQARQVEDYIKIKNKLAEQETEAVIGADTFPAIDEFFIKNIISILIDGVEDFKVYRQYLEARKNKHWYPKYKNIYKALYNAVLLKEFKIKHEGTLPVISATKFIELYTSEYYQVDQYYRQFYQHYDLVSNKVLQKLRDYIERIYKNWFLDNLDRTWNQVVEQELLDQWWIPEVNRQTNFYQDNVQKILDKSNRDKIVVFISDALRYEAGKQLAEELNSETRGEVELEYMQTGLPSTTAFGMAQLLPHEKININKKAEVFVDSSRTSGLSNRKKILRNSELSSTAVKWNSFNKLSRNEQREIVRDTRVFYVYHDVIDSTGEELASEDKVFAAVREALDEIKEAVQYISSSLSGTKILITSDHGFIYTRDSLQEKDLIPKLEFEKLRMKKRYIIAEKNKEVNPGIHKIKLSPIIDSSDYEVLTPKGSMRFKIQGGGRNYVHGGCSLQEIVVPVIKYRHVRKHVAAPDQKPSKVEVELTNTRREITNNTFTVNFYQKRPVNGKTSSRKLKIAVWDMGNESKITDEKIAIFNSTADDPEARQYKIVLRLKQGDYPKDQDYYLRLMEIESEEDYGREYKRYKFKINVIITNDFDF